MRPETVQRIGIADISTSGKIWAPVRFQLVYNYQKIPTNDGKKTVWKSIIADETGFTTLIYLEDNAKASFDRNNTLKVKEFYTITAGGCSARPSSADYPGLVTHPHGLEIWLAHPGKITACQDEFEALKTPFNFNFTTLNMLAQGDRCCDVLARVYWKGTEENASEKGGKYKDVRLEDDTLNGEEQSVICKLNGDHCKTVSKKGVLIAIANCWVVSRGGELMISAGDTSAVFDITNDSESWILDEEQNSMKNNLTTMTVNSNKLDSRLDNEQLTPHKESKKLKRDLEASPSKSTNALASSPSPGKPPPSPYSNSRHRKLTEVDIAQMKEILNGPDPGTPRFKLHATLSNYSLRRYLGCSKCSKSLSIVDEKWICWGQKCRGADRSGPGDRKPFYLLKNIVLSDVTETVSGVIAYDSPIEDLIGNPADCYATDFEAYNALRMCLPRGKEVTVVIKTVIKALEVSLVIESFTLLEPVSLSNPTPTFTDFADDTISPYQNRGEESAVITQLSEMLLTQKELQINVVKCSPGSTISDTDDVYRMTSKPRGVAIHINCMAGRTGSALDNKMFGELFTQLGYKVVTLLDIKSTGLAEQISSCRNTLIEENCDSLVLCVSSHGVNNGVLLADNIIKNIWTDIIYQFDDNNFPTFRGKPKIVLINTCQDFLPFQIESSPPINDPNHSDFLVFISNSPGYKSFRNPELGSYFIRNIAMVLMTHAHNTEIKKMFGLVSKMMKEPGIPRRPQIPEIRDFLFWKSFYFRPQ